MPFAILRQADYPKEITTVGDHLRRKRLDVGLRQRDVAARIGVTAGTVWQWERNRKEPETRYLPAVIDFLGYLPTPLGQSFPDALRTLRRAAGLSQEQLAKRAGIDESTIAKWERGDTFPFPYTAERLRRFFERIGRPMPEFGADGVYGPERRAHAARRAWHTKKKLRVTELSSGSGQF